MALGRQENEQDCQGNHRNRASAIMNSKNKITTQHAKIIQLCGVQPGLRTLNFGLRIGGSTWGKPG
jgi:hypothetical protein